MGLPAKLTHEEQLLLDKFALKKKKKLVAVVPKKQVSSENNAAQTIKEKKFKKEPVKESAPTATVAPKDAKELAKKLLASGQLKINKSGAENRSFKRSKPTTEKKVRPSIIESGIEHKNKPSPSFNFKQEEDSSNSNSFSWNKWDNGNENSGGFHNKQGFSNNNLYVTGYGLTKEILDEAFPPLGPIKKIYFEKEKGYGYVTYQTHEVAEKAINELHGSMVKNVTLRVMYARKRVRDDNRYTWRPKGPNLDEPAADKTEKSTPESHPKEGGSRLPRLADRSSSKPKPEVKRKKRELPTYSDDFEF